MNISKREKILLAVLGAAVLLYVYYSFFLNPILSRTAEAKSNIDKYKSEIADKDSKSGIIEGERKKLEEIRVKFEEAKVALPQMEKSPEIIYSIRKFFEGSGIEITNITLGAPIEYVNGQQKGEGAPNSTGQSQEGQNNAAPSTPAKGKVYAVPVTIAISAKTYSEAMSFITRLENDKRFVEITEVTINANRPGTSVAPEEDTDYLEEPVEEIPEIVPEDTTISVIVVEEGKDSEELAKLDQEDEEQATKNVPVKSAAPKPSQPEPSPEPVIEVVIQARYYYIDSSEKDEVVYEVGSSAYGRNDLFER